MRIALHTPLKPVDHPTPSGDRAMAREFLRLLRALGHRVWLVDSYAPETAVLPAPERWSQQARRSRARAAQIERRWKSLPPRHPQRFDLWLTYHVYYKKPDRLGPQISARLGIPYVVAEASHAPKRRFGPWRPGHLAVERGLRRVDLALNLNPVDAVCLRPLLRSYANAAALPPFLDTRVWNTAAEQRPAHRARLLATERLRGDSPLLLTVAMMRRGDKLQSYRVLAQALDRLRDLDWQLLVVGDGDARTEVEALLRPFADRMRLFGALPPEHLPSVYAAADLYLWPAINEAFGMTLLEAQAAGLPAIAGRTGGVPAVLADGVGGLLTPIGDAPAFAAAVRQLLQRPALRAAMGRAARAYVARRHSEDAARRRLGHLLTGVRRSAPASRGLI